MKINPQLVRWLESEMASDTTRIGVYEGSNYQMYQQMIFTCLHADLIEFDEWTSDVVYYKLTALGEIALGIPAAASEPDTATGDGYQWHAGSEWTHHKTPEGHMVRNKTHDYNLQTIGETINLTSVLNNYRAELIAARERIAALEAEISALGIVISGIGIKVNEARNLLFDSKYPAADSALKNAQVIIQANAKANT